MGVFASDDFNIGTDGSDIVGRSLAVGGTWTDGSPSGSPLTPILKNNRLRQNTNPTTFTYASDTPPSADYEIQCDVTPTVGGSGAVGGVFGRKNAATGSTDAYWADYYDHATAGSRQWRLVKYVASSATVLGTYTENIGTTTTTLRLSMVGTAIKLYVNGVERVAATDSSVTATGRAGIIVGAATSPYTSAVDVDNFVAFTSSSPAALRRRPSGLYIR